MTIAVAMDDQRVGVVFRAVRMRRRLRQADVAMIAGVAHSTISRIEHGHLDTLSLRALRAVARVLEIRLELAPWSRRGDLIRFATADHAQLVESVIAELRRLGWDARAEVSFNNFGERGFIDVLAWHGSTRTLLVIEVKTELVDVGEVVGILDRKVRVAAAVAPGMGWVPSSTSSALIVQDGRTNRRRIAAHAATFRSSFPADGRTFRSHLRRPVGSVAAVAFWPIAHRGDVRQAGSGNRRVRMSLECRRPAP
jgi:transcriptional regulator with XRE-family HTH domain